MSKKYSTPLFILTAIRENPDETYQKWLDRKASAHKKRDHNKHSKEEYKQAIHKAVVFSEGHDFFTGEKLDWEDIGTFGKEVNEKKDYSKKPRLPTVDHLNGRSSNDIDLVFVITGWAVNDAKNDLSYEELLGLCKKILGHKDKCLIDISKLKND